MRYERERAERAQYALDAYAENKGEDPADCFTDLLADLLHLAAREGRDVEAELRMARMHYEAES